MKLMSDGRGLGLRIAGVAAIAVGFAALIPACGDSQNSGGFAGAGGGGAAAGGGGAAGGTGATAGSGATGGGGGGGCPSGQVDCNGTCTNPQYDPANCGNCGTACPAGDFCSQGTCASQCLGSTLCGTACVNTDTDPNNCGGCGTVCPSGEVCSVGVCGVQCAGGATKCGTDCVNLQSSSAHCGACDNACPGAQVCSAGTCQTSCGTNLTKCGNSCVDTKNDKNNCGGCGTVCPSGQACLTGTCGTCDPVNQDCDGDGWAGSAEGDCCEVPGLCGADPSLVNPGAFEVKGNAIDDNCNGLVDNFDKLDIFSCDTGLASDSSVATDYAKAMKLCRPTEETPASKKDKTWGLIDAQLMKADGTPLTYAGARSIRTKFGDNITPTEGSSFAILSSGIASDSIQTNPGPVGGASNSHTGGAFSLSSCTDPKCIKDWYQTANPPLKSANAFPEAPGCSQPSQTTNDSACLYLKIRAPTNARAFSFDSYFMSAEYPEYVCSQFNDQFVALVDTPSGPTSPFPNPPDKNLTTYNDLKTGTKWPIAINIAKGTSLFAVCDPGVNQVSHKCYDSNVFNPSCSLGVSDLLNTGFGSTGTGCPVGGGTYWLTTAGNVNPGQILTLRICIFDVGDSILDSLAILDGFEWLTTATVPGTG
jgi:hypothetical protein